jgi:hypothetical protein
MILIINSPITRNRKEENGKEQWKCRQPAYQGADSRTRRPTQKPSRKPILPTEYMIVDTFHTVQKKKKEKKRNGALIPANWGSVKGGLE